MDVLECIELHSKQTAMLAIRLSQEYHRTCKINLLNPTNASTVVMWGGGKDSTLALILTCAIRELCGCPVRAVTMLHPGQTQGVLDNIGRVRAQLNIEHEYRHFGRRLSSSLLPQNCYQEWAMLFRRLALATGFFPRFMCVACNMGSLVAEYRTINETGARFLITGNPPAELEKFRDWIVSIRSEFQHLVEITPSLGNNLLDYYRFWWSIYETLLQELFPESNIHEVSNTYLYPLPERGNKVESLVHFPVMGDGQFTYVPEEQSALLQAFGWRLPDDLQGGTESDCAFTSIISYINIRERGLQQHLYDLEEAAHICLPLPEMLNRAREWAKTGKSTLDGRSRLLQLEVDEKGSTMLQSRLAAALARMLLRVR